MVVFIAMEFCLELDSVKNFFEEKYLNLSDELLQMADIKLNFRAFYCDSQHMTTVVKKLPLFSKIRL